MSLEALNKQAIGVVVNNSANYIDQVFNLLSTNFIVVPLREKSDAYRIDVANVNRVIETSNKESWLNIRFENNDSTETALVTFTSGTEGEPKGVSLSHQNLADTVKRLQLAMQVDSSIREYIGVPVYLSFGFGRCRLISSIGGSAFIPLNGFNPQEIANLIETDGINSISAVPSLLRILIKNAELFELSGKKIKWIEIGSQYMSTQEKRQLKKIFPNAKIVQHYGLTEASRSTFLDISNTDDEYLESVGQANGEVKIRINEKNRIEIAGPHVAQEYLLKTGSVKLADSDGWFQTSDLGEEKNGYIFYKGRADDVINVGGVKLSPEIIEKELSSNIISPTEFAITRRKDASLGEGFLLVLVETKELNINDYYLALIKSLKSLGVNGINTIAIAVSDNIPKTTSGKVQRKKLENEFSNTKIYKPVRNLNSSYELSSNEKQILILCRQVFNLDSLEINDSFFDLGIGSLSFIELISTIKSVYNRQISVNDIFKNSSVKELTVLIFSSKKEGDKPDHAVDVIRSGDLSRPFFFIGSPVYANHLCKRLSSDRAMYALNIFGLEELYRTKLRTFQVYDIARFFYKELKSLQPNGPYSLGAYCADENTAMEVARLLVKNGDEIEYFGFFDVTANFTKRQSRLKKLLNKVSNVGWSYILLFIKRKLNLISEKIKNIFWKIKFKNTQNVDPEISVFGRDRLVVDRYATANKEYVPKPLAVDITAYRSKEWSSDPLDILISNVNHIEEIMVPGSHTEMFLKEESLKVLVDSVNQKLK